MLTFEKGYKFTNADAEFIANKTLNAKPVKLIVYPISGRIKWWRNFLRFLDEKKRKLGEREVRVAREGRVNFRLCSPIIRKYYACSAG